MKNRILIDTDIAMGLDKRDIDDGLAIVMALNSKQIEVCGITLTYGNDSLENVRTAMDNLLPYLDIQNIEIKNGASSNRELGQKTDATELIIDRVLETKTTLVSIGPVTNIASSILQNPDIKNNIDEIIVVAGRQPGQRFLTGNHPFSHPDLNFERDPDAMQVLIDSNVPITMAPFEVSSKVWFNQRVIDLVKQNNSKLANYVEKHANSWLTFWQETFSTDLYPIDGFNPFDTLAIAWLTDRDLLSWSYTNLKIEEDNYDSTETSVQGTGSAKKPYLHARLKNSQSKKDKEKHIYIHDVYRQEFLMRLAERLK